MRLFSRKPTDLSAKQLMKRIDEGWKPFILDVRSASEARQTGVIPGCELIHPHTSIGKARKKIPQDRDIVINCRGGIRSRQARSRLIEIGYDPSRLHDLRGGILAWQRVSGKTVKSELQG